MSARLTVPATFQCTFSNVTQKIVARNRKRVILTPRGSAAARPAPRRASRAQGACASPGRAACRPGRPRASARARPPSASRIAGHVLRSDDDARAGLADQLGGGAVRRHDRQDRPLGGEVLEDLAGEHAAPAAARLGDQEQQRLRVALELERAAPGDVRDQLEPVAEPEALGPLGVGRAEVADEADDGVRGRTPRSAVRNGRGSRLPKKLPVCVIRSRSTRRYSSPAKSSKSRAVRDRHHPAAAARARAPRPRSRRQRRRPRPRSARPGRRPRARPAPSAGRRALSVRRCGLATSESRRSATQRAPVARLTAAPTKWTELGGEVVSTTSMPSRRTIRIAAGIAVRFQGTFSSGTSSAAAEEPRLGRRARRGPSFRAAPGGPAAARAEVARAMHPRLGRRLELVVAVHPLRVVRREHVRLDPERRQVGRGLQRALDAAAARGREVERDEQDLHGSQVSTRL